MKFDPNRETSEQYVNLIITIQVIEKQILTQTEYLYPFYSVYENEGTLYTFHHNYLTKK